MPSIPAPVLPRASIPPSALTVPLALAALAMANLAGAAAPPPATGPASFPDPAGQWSNFAVGGQPNPNAPFFQALGTNGRTCASCHGANDAWTATPARLQQRFAATGGNDPVFAAVDGTGCPTLDISTPTAHRTASSLLLDKGLIRVAITPPAGAQFSITAVSNPYGCSSPTTVSVYRRILPTTNLAFLSTVMWDGRESLDSHGITADLEQQASDASETHEAAKTAPAAGVLAAIEALEVEQFSAQSADAEAGALTAAGATGGPARLATQGFSPGLNDPFGPSAIQPGIPPNPVFTPYSAWEAAAPTGAVTQAQAAIGRGERIFNTRPIAITGVSGLNDQPGASGRPRTTISGTCGTCHDAPNAGSHSTPLLVDIGLSQAARHTADLPLLTLANKSTGVVRQSSDPGLALTSGNWSDIDKFKVPTLRNLAARAPYFHNGSAATLDQVVDFYNQRFNLNLLPQEHTDLVAFLAAL